MGWTTPSSWGNPRQKVGVLNKYKLLSIIVSTSKYLRASDNISAYLPCSDCFVAGVKARLPILGWLPHYNLNDAVSDAIAIAISRHVKTCHSRYLTVSYVRSQGYATTVSK